MMIVSVPVAVAIIGILMYALCINPKLAEIGRIAYAFGLLVFLLQGVERLVTLVK